MANLVVAQLLFLANEDATADISMYVNSPGGSVTSGLGIVDTMRFIPNDVSTYVIGQAASMGSVIACSGAKGKRYCLPNSENLMHQPLLHGVLEGQATDLEIEARHILRMRDQIYQIYSEQTGQTAEKVAADCERNNWLTAPQMVEYGLADEVLEHLPENTDAKKPEPGD
jgi:ATP-dependent Clp protease protease subunit